MSIARITVKKITFVAGVLLVPFYLHAQINGSFEKGFSGWESVNSLHSASIIADTANKDSYCLRLGNGRAEVFQRISYSSLSIIQYHFDVRISDKNTKAKTFIRFFNKKNHLIISYENNCKQSIINKKNGFYTESPPNTKYVEIGIANIGGDGFVYADNFTLKTNMGEPFIKPSSQVNFQQYMSPFWKSDTIFNETILLLSINENAAKGNLLYTPDKILSVRSFDQKNYYQNGEDYTSSGNTIIRSAKSKMTFRADTSFDTTKNLSWYDTQGQFIIITYTHHDEWHGPFPVYKGELMPNTMALLRSKRPMTIVALGMSITRGMNSSGYDLIPPYMPNYVDLFTQQLGINYHHKQIKVFNAALSGGTINWGAKYTDEYVNALNPDLVILDFGMNDFWNLDSGKFKTLMETMIRKIKKHNSKTEIILLSNMKFDPDFILKSNTLKNFYETNIIGYKKILQSLQTKGVINFDMTTISESIFNIKKPKDCISNPLHPNDYFVRWYAQGMSALLTQP